MRKYMGLLVGLLLLLALAACGNKAAENVEETPGDPTGTVKVVTPQEEQTPEASDGADQQPTSGDQKTPVQQETLQQEKQNEQTGEQGQTSNGGETLPDHWTEGGGPAPSGQQMVKATKNYDCAAAEKLGKDRLIAKGLTYNENLNRDELSLIHI